jgi:hypothetical protein
MCTDALSTVLSLVVLFLGDRKPRNIRSQRCACNGGVDLDADAAGGAFVPRRDWFVVGGAKFRGYFPLGLAGTSLAGPLGV